MILVAGATGNMGRPLVRRLTDSGVTVRAVTRSRRKARAILPEKVEIIEGDLGRESFLRQAFDGVDQLFLGLDSGDASGILAAAAGCRVVLVTSLNAQVFPDGRVGGASLAAERQLRDLGLRGTVLRPWEFASNSLGMAEEVRAGGVVRRAAGSRPSPVIDPADVAAVAAVALTEDGHDGRTYALTGPADLTCADKVAIIGRTIGRTIDFEEYDDLEEIASIRKAPDQLSGRGACYLDSPGVTTTVEEITGRPAGGFERWVTENAAAFRPDSRGPG
ncbi:SDR family oxidoreductase [Actinophytocola sediminis]